MVVVPKNNSKVRICVDLTQLNKGVCHERHILPSVEQTLSQLQGAKVFSKLDANSGFWQIKLSSQSPSLPPSLNCPTMPSYFHWNFSYPNVRLDSVDMIG